MSSRPTVRQRPTAIAILLMVAMFGCRINAPTGNTPARNVPHTALTLDDLDRRPIIGRLGVPLGTLVCVDITVIRGDDLGTKADVGSYRVRVDRVQGKPVSPPLVMPFIAMFTRPKIPSDSAELPALRGGRVGDEPDPEKDEAVEARFIGRSFHFRAYEVGRFDGAPTNLPAVYWQEHGFAFVPLLLLVDNGSYNLAP